MEMYTHKLASEEPASEGRVRDDLDAELAAGGEQVNLGVLNVEREGRVLDLHRGYGVHGVRAAQGVGRDFGKAEVLDFSCPGSDVR
jgi:hypothetical protein